MGYKLNLASGTDIKDGWINLDVVPRWPGTARGCDVIWDARKDAIPFPDGSIEEIYAGYLFLHLAPCFHVGVMNEMVRVLAPGARLVIGEVDMEIVMRRWLANPDSKSLCELIWGEQGDIHGQDLALFDKHCHGWTETTLRQFIGTFGFVGLHRIQIHVSEVFYELTIQAFKP